MLLLRCCSVFCYSIGSFASIQSSSSSKKDKINLQCLITSFPPKCLVAHFRFCRYFPVKCLSLFLFFLKFPGDFVGPPPPHFCLFTTCLQCDKNKSILKAVSFKHSLKLIPEDNVGENDPGECDLHGREKEKIQFRAYVFLYIF